MNQKEVTIALDGMGGDFAPYNNIKGALIASKQSNVNILLVGDPNILKREIENQKIDLESFCNKSTKGCSFCTNILTIFN